MKYLVVGSGSIGKRRIGILNDLGITSIDICDKSETRMDDVCQKYRVEGRYTDYAVALAKKPDVVIICTPPVFHISIAKAAVEAGAGLMIEKPLAHNLDGVDSLIKLIQKKKAIAGVAYTLRFHKGVNLLRNIVEQKIIGKVYSVRAECGQYLPDWHPWEDYRNWYMSKKNEGGGAILDISHEIDYVRWLLGDAKEVGCFYGTISDLQMDADDVAEILLRFKSGAISSIHLDLLQRDYRRNCEIIGEKGTVLWDYTTKQIKVFTKEKGCWETIEYKEERSDMFVEETKHFIKCFEKKAQIMVSVEDAAKTLAIAVSAKESSDSKKIVILP
ncbi:MAG: hypothetical protein A2Y00_03050 [Omnitrophica WOR_2 bacterium GWF2_43_52]|nr:MAG: hypothetical protein A2062_01060 [Omnitrophica WOR_2 bacterium GWA2_44_7]OGX22412.1 MAG: hypothetical protein A2Y00_03050 [Omnitrophica WOR_2 bacterium GWF2_43_52]HAH20830.1 hypothetical protein [Candidatus Omnitrophota bacterium]HBG64498.1 hypothetical protein [Candidatus Omnitrophota bacterium]HCD38480.1 hypothetical protein [Candidatus Omnitrophota bacterium]